MIADNLNLIQNGLPPGVTLVAVSKFHPVETLMEAYRAGQRVFAESRPQELAAKVPLMPEDVRWHFIGHLQTNKLKLVLPHATLVQSVDSFHLLDAVRAWGQANRRVVDILLELHLGAEPTKQGFTEDEIMSILSGLAGASKQEFPPEGGVRIKGLMGMATNTDEPEVVGSDFGRIEALFRRARESFPSLAETFTELSIGMSADWKIALRHGATMVRIGTDIFGPREY